MHLCLWFVLMWDLPSDRRSGRLQNEWRVLIRFSESCFLCRYTPKQTRRGDRYERGRTADINACILSKRICVLQKHLMDCICLAVQQYPQSVRGLYQVPCLLTCLPRGNNVMDTHTHPTHTVMHECLQQQNPQQQYSQYVAFQIAGQNFTLRTIILWMISLNVLWNVVTLGLSGKYNHIIRKIIFELIFKMSPGGRNMLFIMSSTSEIENWFTEL